MDHRIVIEFWFEELTPKDWWKKSDELDRTITSRFLETLQEAKRCELDAWRESPEGRLAEVIVLDQFSRNIFRGKPESFAADPLALALAQEAVRAGADRVLDESWRNFLYMPFLHSESLAMQERALQLFGVNKDAGEKSSALAHYRIVERFGRYPHRNEILGRESTPEEVAFLQEPGSSF